MSVKISSDALAVFNQEVIPVYTTSTGEKVVVGRELHERLSLTERYSKWFDRMVGYGFAIDIDYTPYQMVHPQNGQEIESHILKLDMAKHIAMIQRTPEGHAIRQKLIELEKSANTAMESLSPELQMFHLLFASAARTEAEQLRQAKLLESVNRRMDDTCALISLDPAAWRHDTRELLLRTAEGLGGPEHIRGLYHEAYGLLESRAGVNLKRRLDNKRRRMEKDGASRAVCERIGNLDVIAKDKKLTEIFLEIVKQMALKYGADQTA